MTPDAHVVFAAEAVADAERLETIAHIESLANYHVGTGAVRPTLDGG